MKIELAKSLGFCFGVERAIKIAESNSNSVTYGPLIHNPKEIERLAKNYKVGLAKSFDEVKKSKKVIIRTHGIVKSELEKLKKENIEIIDATCPFVKKPQKIVEEMSKEGYSIVIFGDINHPEVKGVKSYSTSSTVVALSVEELKKEEDKLTNKVAVVSQTTKKPEDFLKVVNYLIINFSEVRVFNTICNATFQNQSATLELATRADVMIIIGGKNSSNTKELLNIAKKGCKDSYLIEDESELKKEWFYNKKLCGISAGASTPNWIIERVKEKIKRMVNE